MRSFLAVADHGSFSRAAHALQIGAASVSDHVGNLERHLKVSLFHRTTRTLQLTHEGADYLAMCREIIARIDDMDGRLARQTGPENLSGLLRIDISDGVDGFLLDPIVAFQRQHPAVAIHLQRSRRQFDLSESFADIAIRSIAPRGDTRPRSHSRQLGSSRTIFLAAPGYLAHAGTPQQPEDLLQHRCIGYVDPISGRLWEWYFKGAGERPLVLDVPCPLALSQGDLRRRVAADGGGVINDIAHFAAPLVRAGALVPILEQWTLPQPICHVTVHRERHRSPRIEAFLAYLEAWLNQLAAAPGDA